MSILIVSLIAAVQAAPMHWNGTSERESAIRQRVAEELRDPASAYFRDVELREREDGQTAVCGYVSGRNGYGGMGEPLAFAYTGAPQLFKTSDEDARLRDNAFRMRDMFCGDRWTTHVRPLDWNKQKGPP